MDNKIKGVLGLMEGGKRQYQVKDGEVDADQFEYCAVLNQILFGPKGLVETLGPTYKMVHDPRFEKVENLMLVEKQGKFGGVAVEGHQIQLADGTFTGGFAGMKQYAEILGEGRHLIGVLQSFAIVEAVSALYPERVFHYDEKSSTPGLDLLKPYEASVVADLDAVASRANGGDAYIVQTAPASTVEFDWAIVKTMEPEFFEVRGLLSPDEQIAVREQAKVYKQYDPHSVETWADERVWGILHIEYTNYFNRKGVPNQDAKTLFAILKGGLLGLVSDYCEIANVQEFVLLDDVNTLYDPAVHNEVIDGMVIPTDHVSMEVENLERALTYRAELRSTAATILKSLGIASQIVPLTDYERDQLLKIIYTSKWPLDKADMVTKVLSYMHSIRLSGVRLEERQFKQINEASAAARKYVEGLRNGSILPINRETDGTVEPEFTSSEALMGLILTSPLYSALFLKITSVEKKLEVAREDFLGSYRMFPGLGIGLEAAEVMLQDYVDAAHGEPVVIASPGLITGDQQDLLEKITKLEKARSILAVIFADKDFKFTEQNVAELDEQMEALDPTVKAKTQEFEGELGQSVEQKLLN